MNAGRAVVLRGDARALPLPDASVDLIVTSPPYFGLRSYTDGCPTCADDAKMRTRGYMERYCPGCGKTGTVQVCPKCGLTTLRTEATKAANRKTDCPDCGGSGQRHYEGQIGSEATPQEWLAALVACTAEWMRVLKPEGSMFVNLGDKYDAGTNAPRKVPGELNWIRKDSSPRGTTGHPKCLLGLPWRYALAATDQLGLILRAEIIWAKPNGLPESVTDRVRRAHEQVFHFTKQPRYYSAVDEIREEHTGGSHGDRRLEAGQSGNGVRHRTFHSHPDNFSALGKLPGSVWDIPSQPLTVPARLGVDHFAAFPMELPRRIILGWSPPGVCVACGQGRRPVGVADYERIDNRTGADTRCSALGDGRGNGQRLGNVRRLNTITGYVCACTPYTDHPGTGSSGEGYNRPGEGIDAGRRITFPDTPGPPSRLSTRPKVGGGREYHFDAWTPPPTRPAVVLDPFSGTGTAPLVASALGRIGIGVDRSADYCRLAKWRTTDPGERAKAMEVPKPPPQLDGQGELFEELM